MTSVDNWYKLDVADFQYKEFSIVMPDSKPDDMISTSDAGKILGVTSKTVIRMIESGEIPGYRVNFVWRLRRQDIVDYLEAHRFKPDNQKDGE